MTRGLHQLLERDPLAAAFVGVLLVGAGAAIAWAALWPVAKAARLGLEIARHLGEGVRLARAGAERRARERPLPPLRPRCRVAVIAPLAVGERGLLERLGHLVALHEQQQHPAPPGTALIFCWCPTHPGVVARLRRHADGLTVEIHGGPVEEVVRTLAGTWPYLETDATGQLGHSAWVGAVELRLGRFFLPLPLPGVVAADEAATPALAAGIRPDRGHAPRADDAVAAGTGSDTATPGVASPVGPTVAMSARPHPIVGTVGAMEGPSRPAPAAPWAGGWEVVTPPTTRR